MKVIIEENYSEYKCNIYIKDARGSKTVIIGYDGKKIVEQDLPDIPVAVKFKPLLSIPIDMKNALISAFINEGQKMNLRTESENHLKGKLTATELHLEDMRKISEKLIDKIIEPKTA